MHEKHKKLTDMLLEIQHYKKTGYISLIITGQAGSNSGMIVVSEGKILKAVYRGSSGNIAIKNILSNEISKVEFIAINRVPSAKDNDIPPLSLIIEMAVNIDKLIQDSIKPSENFDLKAEAKKLIQEIYGDSGAKKVDAIAAKFPPDQVPRDFLDKCRALFSVMFGKDKAEQKFENLYTRIP